jgi:methionyl-tRNA formyltransferase
LAEIDGRQVLITATRLTGQQSNHAAPGTVLERCDDGSLLVQCGDGPLEILIWQEESLVSVNGSGALDPQMVAVSDPS